MLDADRRRSSSRGVPTGDHLAVVHDRHAVAEPLGLVHVVRRQQDRPAGALELVDEIPELPARLRIEAGRRLVEKQQVRIADERAREREPLLLSARERADARVALLLELHQRDHLVRRRAALDRSCGTGAASRARSACRRAASPAAGCRAAGAAPARPAPSAGRAPRRRPTSGCRQALADLDRRRLAGAVRAEQAEALARPAPRDRCRRRRRRPCSVFTQIGDAQGWARLGQGHPTSLAVGPAVLTASVQPRCSRGTMDPMNALDEAIVPSCLRVRRERTVAHSLRGSDRPSNTHEHAVAIHPVQDEPEERERARAEQCGRKDCTEGVERSWADVNQQ